MNVLNSLFYFKLFIALANDKVPFEKWHWFKSQYIICIFP